MPKIRRDYFIELSAIITSCMNSKIQLITSNQYLNLNSVL